MCPIPQLRLVGVRISYIYFFCIFPGHQVLDLITNLYLGPPADLACTLLQKDICFYLIQILNESYLVEGQGNSQFLHDWDCMSICVARRVSSCIVEEERVGAKQDL